MWMWCAHTSCNAWLNWVVYFMNDNCLPSLTMWLVKLCKHICFASCITYTLVIHAYSCKGYIHSIHACDFEIVLNILVFKQVMRNGIVDSSKLLWKMGWFHVFEGEFKYVIEKEVLGWWQWQKKRGKVTPTPRRENVILKFVLNVETQLFLTAACA